MLKNSMRQGMIFAIAALLLFCTLPSFALGLTATGLEAESVSRSWETSAFFVRMKELTGIAVEAQEETDPTKWQ